MKELFCDILVVGAGGGALRAAIAAAETNPELKVQIVTRGKFGQSGVTAISCSDRMAFHATLPYTQPQGADNWRYHAEDIYKIGGFVSDPELAEILAKSSGSAVEDLVQLGVPFVKDEAGRLDQFLTDGSIYPRACYTGPHTANHISQALKRRVEKLKIPVLEEHYCFELAVEEGQVIGAWALPEGLSSWEDPHKELVFIHAKAVILATGGAGEVYEHNVFPPGASGDGYAMALMAGAAVINLEFIQLGLCSTKTKLACSGSIMRAMPRFINSDGEELFLGEKWPELIFSKGASWPLSVEHPAHQIDLLVARELGKGKQVFLDFSTNPQGFSWEKLTEDLVSQYQTEQSQDLGKRRFTSPLARLKEINQPAIQWLAQHGVDLEAGDLLEIRPQAQHFQGGVWINAKAEASLPGLYAVGEVAGGQHGANRPGGNALLDTQVFGKIAGQEGAKFASGSSFGSLPTPPLIAQDDGIEAGEVLTQVRKIMDQYAAVIRWEAGLAIAGRELEHLRKQKIVPGSGCWERVLEAQSSLLVAQAVVKAASLRPESRGPHLYLSTPEGEPLGRDEAYGRSLSLRGTELKPSWISWDEEEEKCAR